MFDLIMPRDNLRRSLEHARSICNPQSPMPLARVALLETVGEWLMCDAVNGELAWHSREPSETTASGRVAVDPHALLERISRLPAGNVRLRTDDLTLHVAGVGTRRAYQLPTVAPEDLTDPPKLATGAVQVQMMGRALARAIDVVTHAIDSDTGRPGQKGIHLVLADGVLLLETADGGRRSARARMPVQAEPGAAFNATVPEVSAEALRKLADEHLTAMTLAVDDRRLEVVAGFATLRAQLVERSYPFPPLDRLIVGLDREANRRATVDRGALADALKALVVALPRGDAKVRFDFVDGELQLSGQGENGGQAVDVVAYDAGPGLEGFFTVEALYAIQALEAWGKDCKRVLVRFGGPNLPIRLSPEVALGQGVTEALSIIAPKAHQE